MRALLVHNPTAGTKGHDKVSIIDALHLADFKVDYVSTKHGLVGMTKVVALEGLPYNITANAICPGATLTPNARKLVAQRMAEKGLSEEDATVDYLSDRQPSHRFIPAETVAALAGFLCTEDASEITGTPLAIDGGWLAS